MKMSALKLFKEDMTFNAVLQIHSFIFHFNFFLQGKGVVIKYLSWGGRRLFERGM